MPTKRIKHQLMQYISYYESPLGRMTMAAEDGALVGLWFEGQKYYAATLDKDATVAEQKVFDEVKRWLDIYFKGECPGFMPKVNPKGSEFRKRVWKSLLCIPYGEVVTYNDIAKEIARERGCQTMSAQAVGGAVGHNPISIIIPCHRVIGSNGSLTGYAGGLGVKEMLLKLEKDPLPTSNEEMI